MHSIPANAEAGGPLLQVRELSIGFADAGAPGHIQAVVNDISFDVARGERVVDAARLNLQKRQLAHEDHMARMERRLFDQRARQQGVEQALVLARSRYELAESRFSLSEKRFRAGQESALARLESQLKKQEALHALELAEINKASVEIETHYLEASSQMENNTQE